MLESRGTVGSRHWLLAALCLLVVLACGGTVRTDGGRNGPGGGGSGGGGGFGDGGFATGNQSGKPAAGGFIGGTGGKVSNPCGPPYTFCGGACVDLSSDPMNCGACFSACPPQGIPGTPNGECVAGSCQSPNSNSCAPNETYCTNFARCLDLQSNLFACGSCTNTCPNGWACVGGKCDPSTCAAGLVPCVGQDGQSVCTDFTHDNQNCGSCGNRCNLADSCQSPNSSPGGKCVSPDCGGSTYCPNTGCVDLTTDLANCGGCDKGCVKGYLFDGAAYACTNGSCGCAPLANNCGSGCTSEFWYCPPPGFQGIAADLCTQSARNAYERCACKSCLPAIQACSSSTACMNAMDCTLHSVCSGCQPVFSACSDQNGAAEPIAAKLVDCMNTSCSTP
jgi:hypothetical protein